MVRELRTGKPLEYIHSEAFAQFVRELVGVADVEAHCADNFLAGQGIEEESPVVGLVGEQPVSVIDVSGQKFAHFFYINLISEAVDFFPFFPGGGNSYGYLFAGKGQAGSGFRVRPWHGLIHAGCTSFQRIFTGASLYKATKMLLIHQYFTIFNNNCQIFR